jgi:hypothetical protein
MAHFAQIENNLVIQVIVVDNNDTTDEQGNEVESIGIQFCTDLIGGVWKQTSYNNNIRKNYAGIGYSYDETRDAFIEPQPYASWVLDEDTCQWESPIPYPTDLVEGEFADWSEETIEWVVHTIGV